MVFTGNSGNGGDIPVFIRSKRVPTAQNVNGNCGNKSPCQPYGLAGSQCSHYEDCEWEHSVPCIYGPVPSVPTVPTKVNVSPHVTPLELMI
jgi:hypothetical protein